MSKPKRERSLADNEAKAVARMLRVSPQKLNLVAQLIRGRKAAAALADLQFSRKRIAVDVKKCLESAIANAENNHDLDVDDLVVLDVGHGGGEAGVAVSTGFHEGGLVEPDGGGLVQPLAVSRQQGGAIGGDGIVDRVPVTGQFCGHLRDRPAPADLDRGPLGRPGRVHAAATGDAVVRQRVGRLRAADVRTDEPVLLPEHRHLDPSEGEIKIGDYGSHLHPGSASAHPAAGI